MLLLARTPDFRASCMGEHAGAAHWLELEYLAAHQLWGRVLVGQIGHPETLEHFSNLPPTMDTLCDQQRAQAQGIARSHIARANAMEALKFK